MKLKAKFGQHTKIGESAYETAVRLGFIGTEEEWLASLKGEKGDQGLPGADGVDGVDGVDGAPGQKGDKGDQGEKGDPGNDYVITEADKTDIVNSVLSALPTWEGGSY